jgi:hypothetical protein
MNLIFCRFLFFCGPRSLLLAIWFKKCVTSLATSGIALAAIFLMDTVWRLLFFSVPFWPISLFLKFYIVTAIN